MPENIPHLSSPAGSATTNGGGGGSSSSVGSGGLPGTGPGGGGLGAPLLAPHHVHQAHQAHQAGSPVKESSFLNRETSADDLEGKGSKGSENAEAAGIPIRR